MLAAAREDFSGRAAKLLIEKGANPSAKAVENYNNTALHIASYRGNVETVRVLLDANADFNALDAQGADPVFYAVQSTANAPGKGSVEDYTNILKLYRDHGRDITYCSVKFVKAPSLVIAAEVGHKILIDLILECGADVNAQHPEDGDTALHYAAKGGNLKLVKHLLAAGANTRARRWDIRGDGQPSGTLPLEMVLFNGNFRIAHAIFEHEKNREFDDYPPVPEGCIHASASNVHSIRLMVNRYLNEGGPAFSGDYQQINLTSSRSEGRAELQAKTKEYLAKKPRRTCASCNLSHYEMKACSRCKSVYYCNRKCQVAHWPVHKTSCK